MGTITCSTLQGSFVIAQTRDGRQPRFLQGEPPTDTGIADGGQKTSRRVIRTLRRLGYLEASINGSMATDSAPLCDYELDLTRTMAASVTQRIAFGERAGQKVRRIALGFGYEGNSLY
jgi:hypothetical protein